MVAPTDEDSNPGQADAYSIEPDGTMTKQRIERLREKLEERKLDALFIASPETGSPVNRRYLSGFTGTSAYLLIPRDDAVIVTDFRYSEQAALPASGARWRTGSPGRGTWRNGRGISWRPTWR